MSSGFGLVECDGVSPPLFHLMWHKDELECGVQNVAIPDTIVYRHRQAAGWYFTSRDGTIKRKNKANTSNAKIEESFIVSKLTGCDVVATYVWVNDDGETIIEHFDEAALKEFLYHRQKANSGILQRFVEPRGLHNSMVRAVWSPKVCMLERRENILKLHDTKHSLYERTVTFEGEEYNSRVDPVRGKSLPVQVQAVCESIVNHVAEVSFQKLKINRMVLNLKVDASGKLWMLWCSSIRLEGGNVDSSTTVPRHSSSSPTLLLSTGRVPLGTKLTGIAPLPKTIVDVDAINATTSSSGAGHEGVGSGYDDDDDAAVTAAYPQPLSDTAKRGTVLSNTKGASSSRLNRTRTISDRELGGGALGGVSHHTTTYAFLSETKLETPLVDDDTCPSCGSSLSLAAPSSSYVQYKTIIAHYNQVLRMLELSPVESADAYDSPVTPRNTWPSVKVSLSMAGGVGLFAVFGKKGGSSGRGRGEGSPVSEIPPIIHALEPTLSHTDYRQLKRDAFFQNKQIRTCEGCFLVYAKIAGLLIEGASIQHAVEQVIGKKAQTLKLKQRHALASTEGLQQSKMIRELARQQANAAMQASLHPQPAVMRHSASAHSRLQQQQPQYHATSAGVVSRVPPSYSQYFPGDTHHATTTPRMHEDLIAHYSDAMAEAEEGDKDTAGRKKSLWQALDKHGLGSLGGLGLNDPTNPDHKRLKAAILRAHNQKPEFDLRTDPVVVSKHVRTRAGPLSPLRAGFDVSDNTIATKAYATKQRLLDDVKAARSGGRKKLKAKPIIKAVGKAAVKPRITNRPSRIPADDDNSDDDEHDDGDVHTGLTVDADRFGSQPHQQYLEQAIASVKSQGPLPSSPIATRGNDGDDEAKTPSVSTPKRNKRGSVSSQLSAKGRATPNQQSLSTATSTPRSGRQQHGSAPSSPMTPSQQKKKASSNNANHKINRSKPGAKSPNGKKTDHKQPDDLTDFSVDTALDVVVPAVIMDTTSALETLSARTSNAHLNGSTQQPQTFESTTAGEANGRQLNMDLVSQPKISDKVSIGTNSTVDYGTPTSMLHGDSEQDGERSFHLPDIATLSNGDLTNVPLPLMSGRTNPFSASTAEDNDADSRRKMPSDSSFTDTGSFNTEANAKQQVEPPSRRTSSALSMTSDELFGPIDPTVEIVNEGKEDVVVVATTKPPSQLRNSLRFGMWAQVYQGFLSRVSISQRLNSCTDGSFTHSPSFIRAKAALETLLESPEDLGELVKVFQQLSVPLFALQSMVLVCAMLGELPNGWKDWLHELATDVNSIGNLLLHLMEREPASVTDSIWQSLSAFLAYIPSLSHSVLVNTGCRVIVEFLKELLRERLREHAHCVNTKPRKPVRTLSRADSRIALNPSPGLDSTRVPSSGRNTPKALGPVEDVKKLNSEDLLAKKGSQDTTSETPKPTVTTDTSGRPNPADTNNGNVPTPAGPPTDDEKSPEGKPKKKRFCVCM